MTSRRPESPLPALRATFSSGAGVAWRRRHGAALAVLLMVCGAATAVPVRPIGEVVPDLMPGDLELAVIPTPRVERGQPVVIPLPPPVAVIGGLADLRAGRQQLADLVRGELLEADTVPAECLTVLVLGRRDSPAVRRCAESLPAVAQCVAELPAGDEAYALIVGTAGADQPAVVCLVGDTPQARFWGLQSLRQLCWREGDTVYAREVEIVDWPAFALRGCKRAQVWEHALKANFRYSVLGGGRNPLVDVDLDGFGRHFMDQWMPDLLLGRELDDSEAKMAEMEQQVRGFFERGATGICLHLDDQPMAMTPETAARHGGSYEAAVVAMVRRLYAVARAAQPDALVTFIPQPYWTASRYPDYAAALLKAGGLPDEVGLFLCGPEVTSPAIPPDDLARYRESFRLTGTKALIYDNYLRSNCFRAIEARPAALAEQLLGVSTETGSATSRITRLDWAWNPAAYDEERSLRLACRELGGLRHQAEVYRAVSLAEGRLPERYDDQEEALAAWRSGTAELTELLPKLAALRDQGGLTGRVSLPRWTEVLTDHPLDGALDELVLFSRALGTDELSALRERGSRQAVEAGEVKRDGLVAAWLFDQDGATAPWQGRLPDVKVVGGDGLRWVDGRYGRAVRMPGQGSYLEVPPAAELDLARFTLAAWVKPRRTGRFQIIARKAAPASGRNYSLIIAPDGRPYVDIYPQPGPEARTPVVDEAWHHLAACCDGTQVTLWIDGKLEGTTRLAKPLAAGAGPLHLGAMPAAAPGLPRGFAYDLVDHLRRENQGVITEEATDEILTHAFRFATAARATAVIDGDLTDACWRSAPEQSGVNVAHNGTQAADQWQGGFRVAYDEATLYLAVWSRDGAAGRHQAPDRLKTMLTNGLSDSRCTVLLDPGRTRRRAMVFALDDAGEARDALYDSSSAAAPQGEAWESGWRHAVKVAGDGWAAEAAIPLAALGRTPAAGEVWGLNLWLWKPGTPALIWSNKIWWWGYLDVRQAGNVRFR